METNSPNTPLFFTFFLLLLVLPHLINSTPTSNHTGTSTCSRSIAECNEESEILMESESSRRFLEQRRYISPGALKRDEPVCNNGASGEPYSRSSGCLPRPSNPYNRGCSRYYRCRDDS